MKSSLILASACVTLALANPLAQRDIKTEVVYEYVTVTVTGTGPSPTATLPTETPAAEIPVETPAETVETVENTANTDGAAGAFFSSAPTQDFVPEVSAPTDTPAAPAPDTSNLSDYAAPILENHNTHRARHNVPALEWDDNLASIATMIGQTCQYGHDTAAGGGGYGQNIAAGVDASQIGPQVITEMMYNGEIGYYPGYGGEPDMSNFSAWGHFSQIVWKSSTKVGCATVTCPTLFNKADGSIMRMNTFTVCNYSPPGNFAGQYGENVLAPTS